MKEARGPSGQPRLACGSDLSSPPYKTSGEEFDQVAAVRVLPRLNPRGVAAPGDPPHPPGHEGSPGRGVVGAQGGLCTAAIHHPTARGPTQERAPHRGPPAGCTRLSLTPTSPALVSPSARGCPFVLPARPLGPRGPPSPGQSPGPNLVR